VELIVTCCQLAPVIGDFAGNRARVEAAVAEAAAGGAGVIVLPELALSGYCFDSVEEARALSVPAGWPGFAELAALAPDAVVVLGFAELAATGELFNSAAMLFAGHQVTYRKVHLWDREKEFFLPGSEPAPVVSTPFGRLAMMVCYDLEFPEYTRSVALRGAQLLAVPTNWPLIGRPAGQPAPEVVIAMAAARVNRMAIAVCDRQGIERGQEWNQASTVIGPDGWPLATVDAQGRVRAELNLTGVDDKGLSERNDLFRDRRPELY